MAQELEERIAHLEKMLDELSDVVKAQRDEMDGMARILEALRQKALADAQASDGGVRNHPKEQKRDANQPESTAAHEKDQPDWPPVNDYHGG